METSPVAKSEGMWVAGVCRGQAKHPTTLRTTLNRCGGMIHPQMLNGAEVEKPWHGEPWAACRNRGPVGLVLPEPRGTGGRREGVTADTTLVEAV